MKKQQNILLISIFLLSIIIMHGCYEIGPQVSFKDAEVLIDTTYIDLLLPPVQHKNVIIEEFTGVNCTNCPQGADKTHDIYVKHKDSIVLVAIHNSNPLAKPFDGYEDFRTTEGIQISDKLGGTGAIPSASIDRIVFPGETQEAVFLPFWEGYTKTRLKQPVRVNIELESDYDDANRELKVTAILHYLEDIDTLNHISIMITESDIKSPQKMPDLSVDTNYIHKHVLRGMITSVFGNATNETTEKGRVIVRQYKYKLAENWKADNCFIVAFVHFVGNSNEVLQSKYIPVN
jgi:Outer membrane protein Omp28